MSTDSNSAIVSAFQAELLGAYTNTAMPMLVFYEYCLTIKYEVDFVWRRKWSAVTWIFVANRYFMIATALLQLLPVSQKVCNSPGAMNALVFICAGPLIGIIASVFGILRVSALIVQRPWKLLATWTLIVLCLVSTAASMVDSVVGTWIYVGDPLLGLNCDESGTTLPPDILFRVTVVESAASIVGGVITVAVTLLRTFSQVRQASSLGLPISLSQTLLRDGSLFFMTELVLDILAIALAVPNLLSEDPTANVVTTPIVTILPQIVLSRFIINLRYAETHGAGAGSSVDQGRSRSSHISFRMPTRDEIAGNIGEPLDFGDYDIDDESPTDVGTQYAHEFKDEPVQNIDSDGIIHSGVERDDSAGPSQSKEEYVNEVYIQA